MKLLSSLFSLLILLAIPVAAQPTGLTEFTATSLTISPADDYTGGAYQGVQIVGFASDQPLSGGVRNVPSVGGYMGPGFLLYNTYPNVAAGMSWVYDQGPQGGNSFYFTNVPAGQSESLITATFPFDVTTTASTRVFAQCGHFTSVSLRAWATWKAYTSLQYIGSTPSISFTLVTRSKVFISTLTSSLAAYGLKPLGHSTTMLTTHADWLTYNDEGSITTTLDPGTYSVSLIPMGAPGNNGEALLSIDVLKD